MTRRALILRAAGTNCDEETQHALECSGVRAERVHVNALSDHPELLDEVEVLVLPGGFTYGDDVASAAVLAHTLERRLRGRLQAFVESGRLVLGICNGFQALVRLGLLPASGGRAALLHNHSQRFEARWVRLRAGAAPGPWFEPGERLEYPVAHAEGRFAWFPETPGAPFPEGQIALRYVGGDGEPSAGYPANPNGSHLGIAGVTNARGNVLGLMPHPERFTQPQHYPRWTAYRRGGAPPAEGDLPVPLGLELFRRIARARIDG